MKTIKILYYLFIFLLFYSCINRSGKSIESSTLEEYSSAFAPSVVEAVKESVEYLSSIGTGMAKDSDIIVLLFDEDKKNDHYLIVYKEPFFIKEYVKGYSYIEGYTIVYYGNDIKYDNLIDDSKLIPFNGSISGFVDYDDFPKGHYDPDGIKYKIINSDSLVVVYKGML